MHKYELLRQRADAFKLVLEEYAKKDKDIEWLLQKFMPWYERIQKRKIRLPCHDYQLGGYFFNSDWSEWGNSNIADRYYRQTEGKHPLVKSSVLFDAAMGDWLSSRWYLEQLKANGETPSVILDELPPPEEETPLEPEIKQKTKGIRDWLYQLIFGAGRR